MRLIALASIALFTAGCGKFTYREYVPDDVKPYLDEFEQAYGVDPTVVAYAFRSLPDDSAGKCVGATQVLLSTRYWPQYPTELRRALIWHEIGHCIFGLDHDNSLFSDQCPASLMGYRLPSRTCYLAHRLELEADYRSKIGH